MGREENPARKRTADGVELLAQTLSELTKPHIESFDYFVDRGLQAAVLGVQPVQVTHPLSGNTLRNILGVVIPVTDFADVLPM